MIGHRFKISIAAIALTLSPVPSNAQTATSKAIVGFACGNTANPEQERIISRSRLARAIYTAAGYLPDGLLDTKNLGDTISLSKFDALMFEGLLNTEKVPATPEQRNKIDSVVVAFAQDVSADSQVQQKDLGMKLDPPIKIESPNSPTEPITGARKLLFSPQKKYTIICLAGKAAEQYPAIAAASAPTEVPRFGLVKDTDSLSLVGDERAAAGSAKIGVTRSKARQDDGSSKTDTQLNFDGTFGVRLTGNQANTHSFGYASYTLNRSRSFPAPELTGDARRDDGDTNVLELGLSANDYILPGNVSLIGQIGYIANFVKGSRRIRSRVLFEPSFGDTDFGLCRVGQLSKFKLLGAKFRTKCYFALGTEFSHVPKVGRDDFKNSGEFFAAGPIIGIDLAPPFGSENGIVSQLRYQYLPVLAGTAAKIERWDASLAYRFWVADGVGLDFGGNYKRGTNLKSLEKENILELSFGIIF
jgi:hypothetical protein